MKLHLFRKRTKSGSSKHLNNILSGETIYIDGKPYVKVKVRFVDSLNFKTEKHLDNLETEIESLRKEVDRLTSLNTAYEKKIEDLQMLNINLYRQNEIKTTKLSHTVDKLFQRKNQLELEKENLKTQTETDSLKISDQMEIIIRLREKIFNQKSEIYRLLKKEKEAKNKISDLDLLNRNLMNEAQAKIARLQKKNHKLLREKSFIESQIKDNGNGDELQE